MHPSDVVLGISNRRGSGRLKLSVYLYRSSFGKLRNDFSSTIPQCLKATQLVFDQFVLPVMTYGTETWIHSGPHKKAQGRSASYGSAVAMLSVSLRDRIKNEEIRKQTEIAQRISNFS